MQKINLVAIFLFFFPLCSAFAADGPPSPTARKALAAAQRFLERYPERRADFIPDGYSINGQEDIEIQYKASDASIKSTRLNSVKNSLVDLGLTLRGKQDQDNLFRAYKLIRKNLPAKLRRQLTKPSELKNVTLKEMRGAYRKLLELIDLNFDFILRRLEPGVLLPFVTNPIADCSAEIGTESAGFDSEVSDRCEVADYDPDGLFLNIDFPLKDNITCIKDQGRRGTCAAHAIAAAVESWELVNGGVPENLSEQHIYHTGEKEGDSQIDTFEPQNSGLCTGLTIDEFDDQNLPIYYEEDWNYNRSLSIGSLTANLGNGSFSYPNSCGAYSGESCTDYVFQTTASIPLFAVVQPNNAPSGPSSVHRIHSFGYLYADFPGGVMTATMLQSAIILLAADVPVVLSMNVTDAFRNTTDGYVRYTANDPVGGGHAMELIGFVPNSQLPPGVADAEEQGFFIVKNSWGTDSGDCGFYYLDYKYLRYHTDYISFFEIN